jgi:hypothetical protein
VPLKALPVTTSIENYYVKISWQKPDDQSSAITAYDIRIQQSDGAFSKPIGQFCQGSDLAIVKNNYCHIPMQSALLVAPYNLVQGTIVVVIIKAKNSIGWAADFSDPNTAGALM